MGSKYLTLHFSSALTYTDMYDVHTSTTTAHREGPQFGSHPKITDQL